MGARLQRTFPTLGRIGGPEKRENVSEYRRRRSDGRGTATLGLQNLRSAVRNACDLSAISNAKIQDLTPSQLKAGAVAIVVTIAMITIIENSAGEITPSSRPTLSTINSIRPRVFISVASAPAKCAS